MIFNEEQINQEIKALAARWQAQELVYPNLNKMPKATRPSNTSISAGILWPMSGRLEYACTNDAQDWTFESIGRKKFFYFKTDQWMMRNSDKHFSLCKIEWQPSITLITVNDNGTKYYLEKNALPSELLQQFFQEPDFDKSPELFFLHMHSLIGLSLSHLLHTPQQVLSKSYRTYLACCEHAREHLDQDIDRNGIAEVLDIHPGHVSRLFKQYHEGGYDSWLRQERVKRAKQLLSDPQFSIEDIARLCGISNTSWFIRCFKDETGSTPGQYRLTI